MFVLPLYVAVTTVEPGGSALVAMVAAPPARVTVPRVVAPATKVIVPAGAGPVAEMTVAVNRTFCPALEGLTDD